MLNHSSLSYLLMTARVAHAHLSSGINKQRQFPDEVAGHLVAAHEELRDLIAQLAALRLELGAPLDEVLLSRGILAANMPALAAE